ncbi:general stress protein [Alteribacillus iranensis]|uniref:Heat induced stress protein YflT n=1 Tax=Alteribacillus iranensis TaxID=930128 RepID=A0A1I2E3Z0_9BACI|nr:general stress protein [Alteribacillus iranensis]SFE87379.1 Heat induced stress protein YflT [Alteribacillus iranensis]
MQKKIIGGVFQDQQDAINAIEALKMDGYATEDITVFSKNKNDLDALENKTGASTTDDSTSKGKGASIGKGAGIGAGSGGVLGALVGLGLLAIPGIGQIAAAGPLAAGLGGAGIGAGGGGIVGALVGAGIPEEHAKDYEAYLKKNHIVVLVEADIDQESKVYDTFNTHRTENSHMYPDNHQRGMRL